MAFASVLEVQTPDCANAIFRRYVDMMGVNSIQTVRLIAASVACKLPRQLRAMQVFSIFAGIKLKTTECDMLTHR